MLNYQQDWANLVNSYGSATNTKQLMRLDQKWIATNFETQHFKNLHKFFDNGTLMSCFMYF